ncbi:MAG: hypothetical protein ACJZ1Q_00070 [Candidatus Neomarinimicrobiota bacterium]|tara:strand:+ start:801 stop:974 length:174 start_codon:yes stop_codon:yes gene_type:complete
MSSVTVTQSEKFCIISAYSEDHVELVQKIEIMLKEGWTLSGGLTASNSRLYQALSKS